MNQRQLVLFQFIEPHARQQQRQSSFINQINLRLQWSKLQIVCVEHFNWTHQVDAAAVLPDRVKNRTVPLIEVHAGLDILIPSRLQHTDGLATL